MYQLILICHVLAAVCLIVLVLIQQGRGAAVGAAFGSGASQTVFGSRGSGSFLLKVTIGFAFFFFATSIILNNMASRAVRLANQELNLPIPVPVSTAPAAPVEKKPSTSTVLPSNLPSVPKPPVEKKP